MLEKIDFVHKYFMFKIRELISIVNDIFTGYYNYWAAIFGYISEDEIEKHDAKALLCTKDCPLRGNRFGHAVCDGRKSIMHPDGYEIEGCGCFIAPKLWSDSPCPRDLW